MSEKKQQKISLSNFTGSSISLPSGMPGEKSAKRAKGYGQLSDPTMRSAAKAYKEAKRKVAPGTSVKQSKGRLPADIRPKLGGGKKRATPGRGQAKETRTVRRRTR